MKLQSLLYIFLIQLLTCLPLSASKTFAAPAAPVIQNTQNESCETNTSVRPWWNHERTPDRMSFPTRSGFALLRKEDIVLLTIDAKLGGLLLKYRKRDVLKSANCQLTLSKANEALGNYPFVKVSRSTIVNVNAIDQFIGNRRHAKLLMDDGSEVGVSRSMAKVLYDWLEKL